MMKRNQNIYVTFNEISLTGYNDSKNKPKAESTLCLSVYLLILDNNRNR